MRNSPEPQYIWRRAAIRPRHADWSVNTASCTTVLAVVSSGSFGRDTQLLTAVPRFSLEQKDYATFTWHMPFLTTHCTTNSAFFALFLYSRTHCLYFSKSSLFVATRSFADSILEIIVGARHLSSSAFPLDRIGETIVSGDGFSLSFSKAIIKHISGFSTVPIAATSIYLLMVDQYA